jgi:hypothetical protein
MRADPTAIMVIATRPRVQFVSAIGPKLSVAASMRLSLVTKLSQPTTINNCCKVCRDLRQSLVSTPAVAYAPIRPTLSPSKHFSLSLFWSEQPFRKSTFVIRKKIFSQQTPQISNRSNNGRIVDVWDVAFWEPCRIFSKSRWGP